MFIRYAFVLLIFLQAQTCDNAKTAENTATESKMENQSLQTVVMKHHGGMMSHEEILTVNAQTMTYSFKNIQNPKPQVVEEKTPQDLWNLLTAAFNEQKFQNLTNGSSHLVYDGMDDIFTVTGDFGEMQVTNPLDNSEELKPFFDLLNQKRHDLYMKVTQQQ